MNTETDLKWRDIHFLGHSMSVRARFITGHAAPNVQDHDAPGFADDGVPDEVEDLQIIIIHGENQEGDSSEIVANTGLRDMIENAKGFVEACFEGGK